VRTHRSLLLVVPLVLVAAGACDVLVPRSEGEKLWRNLCADCHGVDGAGNTVRYMGDPWADLRDDSWKTGGDRDTVETTIRQGIFGQMPAHDELTPAQMKALLDYFYQLRGETE
jgi:cytochrome c oxidase cbb3-type subunit 3